MVVGWRAPLHAGLHGFLHFYMQQSETMSSRPALDMDEVKDRVAFVKSPSGSAEVKLLCFQNEQPPAKPSDDTLVFHSCFETGNLHAAARVRSYSHGAARPLDDQTYELYVNADVCFPADVQWWFHFQIDVSRWCGHFVQC